MKKKLEDMELKKDKKKIRINLLINIILGVFWILVIIWIFYLKNQIDENDYTINMLYKQKDDMINTLNDGKEELNILKLQNQNVQIKHLLY